MGLFIDAIASNEVTYDKGAIEVDTSYNLGDGFHKVEITGSKTNISTGKGNTIVKHYGDNSNISTGNGWNQIKSLGNNKSISTGDQDDDVVFIGDNIDLKTNGGNDNVVFWGNDCKLKLGDGDDSVTTYDQIYIQKPDDELAQDFLDRLRTGTWEDWKLRTKDVIDVKVDASMFRTKTTTVYENHFDVYSYFSRYIDGVKNTTTDMGTGKDKANVTLGEGSSISVDKTNAVSDDTIIKNQKWQIDELTGVRDEVKITYETKKSTNWKSIAMLGAAVIIAVCTFGSASALSGCLTTAAAANATAATANVIATTATTIASTTTSATIASAAATTAAIATEIAATATTIAAIATTGAYIAGTATLLGVAGTVATGVSAYKAATNDKHYSPNSGTKLS